METATCPVQTELRAFHFAPLASCPVTGHNCEEPGYVCFTLPDPHQQAFMNFDKITHTSLFFSRLESQLSWPFLLKDASVLSSSLWPFVEVNKTFQLIWELELKRANAFLGKKPQNKTQSNNLSTVKRM